MALPSSYLTELKLSNGCNCFVKEPNSNTYKLVTSIKWKDIVNINHSINYFQLEKYEIVDGQFHTIDLEDLSIGGLFATDGSGNDINTVSFIKNLGILNGSMNANGCSYFLRSFQRYAHIDNCFSTGPIGFYDGSNNLISNGICCQLVGSPNACLISNCFSTGDIYGQRSGGIGSLTFGFGGEHTIINCYSTGNIYGDFAGGIVGDHLGFGSNSTGRIINCYSLGIVYGTQAGGITSRRSGLDNGKAIIQNCYSKDRLIGSGDDSSNSICLIQNCYSLEKLFEETLDFSNNIVVQNSIANATLPFSTSNINTLNSPSTHTHNLLLGSITYTTAGNSYLQDTFGTKIEYPLLEVFRSSPWRENAYNNYDDTPSNFPLQIQYKGPPFYFYTSLNPNYTLRQRNNSLVFELPKKAKVFNKQEHRMTKAEILHWASRNKYR